MTERERLIELISNYTEDVSARDLHKAGFDENFAEDKNITKNEKIFTVFGYIHRNKSKSLENEKI